MENNIEADGFCPNEVPVLMQLKSGDPMYEEKCARFELEFGSDIGGGVNDYVINHCVLL